MKRVTNRVVSITFYTPEKPTADPFLRPDIMNEFWRPPRLFIFTHTPNFRRTRYEQPLAND